MGDATSSKTCNGKVWNRKFDEKCGPSDVSKLLCPYKPVLGQRDGSPKVFRGGL